VTTIYLINNKKVMVQKTAVEYLMDKLYDPSYDIKKQIKWFEQAKQMEDDRIEELKYRINELENMLHELGEQQ
jgi:hypothetical protein